MAFQTTITAGLERLLGVRIINSIERALSQAEMLILANFAKKMIIDRTRAGFGANGLGGARTSLDRHSSGYTAFRRRNSSRLDSSTSPGTSNLTFTGAMLRGLTCTISGRGLEKVITIRGRDRATQNKINWAHQSTSNRPNRSFLFLTGREITEFRQEFRENFRRQFSV